MNWDLEIPDIPFLGLPVPDKGGRIRHRRFQAWRPDNKADCDDEVRREVR